MFAWEAMVTTSPSSLHVGFSGDVTQALRSTGKPAQTELWAVVASHITSNCASSPGCQMWSGSGWGQDYGLRTCSLPCTNGRDRVLVGGSIGKGGGMKKIKSLGGGIEVPKIGKSGWSRWSCGTESWQDQIKCCVSSQGTDTDKFSLGSFCKHLQNTVAGQWACLEDVLQKTQAT